MEALQSLLSNLGLDPSLAEQPFVQIAAALAAFGLFVITFMALGDKEKPVHKPVEVLPTSTGFHHCELAQKVALSHNTALYKFKIPAPVGHISGLMPAPILGLPIGQHISLTAEIAGKNVQRKYTPTTLDGEDPGHFHLVVKTYPEGNISRHLSLLTVGQHVQVKGPSGKFIYNKDLAPHLLMIAGGTGITPMYQIIKASVNDPKDKTVLKLLYANVNEDDICKYFIEGWPKSVTC